jgi:hypothetical protein
MVYGHEDGIKYSEGDRSFVGTSGILRRRGETSEMAIFHGSHIASGGLRLTVSHTELGASAVFSNTGEVKGLTYTEKPGTLSIEWTDNVPTGDIYIDGTKQVGTVSGKSIKINIPTGLHRWQFTKGLPQPNAPIIIRTENISGGAKVFFTPVAGAANYRIEISSDNGKTWKTTGTTTTSPYMLSGLSNDQKIHVRAIAFNQQSESEPTDEYPIYVSKAPPSSPDGLATRLDHNRVDLTWGEVLGAIEYRLYRRKKETQNFTLIYKGLNRSFTDAATGVIPAYVEPGNYTQPQREDALTYALYEYAVTAVNGNGESLRSTPVDTSPISWRNWDPTNWERFKYEFINLGYRDGMYVIEPNNPEKVRYIE